MPITYKKIASATVVNATQAEIVFADIPTTYDDLVLFTSLRRDESASDGQLALRFNGDTGSTNYSSLRLQGNGSAASSTSFSGQNRLYIGQIGNSTDTASTFNNTFIYIPNYRVSQNKSVSSDSVSENNATTAFQMLFAGLWTQTNAITSVTVLPVAGNLVQHSTATLYGISRS